MFIIGVDIGGTNLKVGLIEDGKLIDKALQSTNSFDLIKQIISMISEIAQKNNISIFSIDGIGIGCPGLIKDGIIVASPNLQLFDCKLAEILTNELGVQVILNNDGDMATLGEYSLGGAGEGCKNMVMLTIGTGVGGGIIINGELYSGNLGAGELGHITFERNGIQCNCGRKGCMEKYISCSALSSLTAEYLKKYPNTVVKLEINGMVSVTKLIEAYKNNDECARIIVDNYILDLTEGVLNYCNIFKPDKIIIGGGLSYAPEIINMVAKACKEQNYGYVGSDKVDIVAARYGNDAGIMGAYELFK